MCKAANYECKIILCIIVKQFYDDAIFKIWPCRKLTEDLKLTKMWLNNIDSLLILLREISKGGMILNVVSCSLSKKHCSDQEAHVASMPSVQKWSWFGEIAANNVHLVTAKAKICNETLTDHGKSYLWSLIWQKNKIKWNTGAWIYKYTYRVHWK